MFVTPVTKFKKKKKRKDRQTNQTQQTRRQHWYLCQQDMGIPMYNVPQFMINNQRGQCILRKLRTLVFNRLRSSYYQNFIVFSALLTLICHSKTIIFNLIIFSFQHLIDVYNFYLFRFPVLISADNNGSV